MKVNLWSVWRGLEAEQGERITYQHVSEATGLSTTTLLGWMKGRINRAELKTLGELCRFFECEVGDLLVYVPEEE